MEGPGSNSSTPIQPSDRTERWPTQEAQSQPYILGDPEPDWASLNLGFSFYKMRLKEYMWNMISMGTNDRHRKVPLPLPTTFPSPPATSPLSVLLWMGIKPSLPVPQITQEKEKALGKGMKRTLQIQWPTMILLPSDFSDTTLNQPLSSSSTGHDSPRAGDTPAKKDAISTQSNVFICLTLGGPLPYEESQTVVQRKVILRKR